jgi:hypothetical protein
MYSLSFPVLKTVAFKHDSCALLLCGSVQFADDFAAILVWLRPSSSEKLVEEALKDRARL